MDQHGIASVGSGPEDVCPEHDAVAHGDGNSGVHPERRLRPERHLAEAGEGPEKEGQRGAGHESNGTPSGGKPLWPAIRTGLMPQSARDCSRAALVSALAFLGMVSASPLGAQSVETIADPRDGYRYPVVVIGSLGWFAENLRFATGDSRCYWGDQANCEDHGRLYRWDDAMRACPAGWRLPTEDDWRGLERTLGMAPEEIEKDHVRGEPVARRLKYGGDTGFNVRYSGWIDPYKADSSLAMGRNAAFWTATLAAPDEDSPTAWHRDVATTRNSIWRSPVNVTYWLSVRCVAGR